MYHVINSFHRDHADTKFFAEASKENKALNDAYEAAESAADGYRGRTSEESKNDKRVTVTILWRDKEAADRFMADAALTFADFLAQREAYYCANWIRHKVHSDDVPDVAPPVVPVAEAPVAVKKVKRAKKLPA
jgi:hypothetical protein